MKFPITVTYRQLEAKIYRSQIRGGKPLNNGQYMAQSTLLAIMGRMATYTGQQVTWPQALQSKEDLTPPKYAWGDAPEAPIAVPGVTKLV